MDVFARYGCRVCGNTAAYPLRALKVQDHVRGWQCGICHAVITDVLVRPSDLAVRLEISDAERDFPVREQERRVVKLRGVPGALRIGASDPRLAVGSAPDDVTFTPAPGITFELDGTPATGSVVLRSGARKRTASC